MRRCDWVTSDPLYQKYHDEEWGLPVYEDQKLFEFLVLESAQAGLSWLTILKRRENYRKAFAHFEADKVARFGSKEIERLLLDEGIIRNRKKIEATVANAKAFLKIQEEYGSFARYNWDFVDGKPIQNSFETLAEIKPTTPISDQFSKDLKQRGFQFLGSTVIYAHMQAVGMVNDHLTSCFCYQTIKNKELEVPYV